MQCVVEYCCPGPWYLQEVNLGITVYRIVGNFRGAKYSWFLWLELRPRIFYPRMKRPCLPLLAVQACSNHENITREMSQYY